MTQKGCDRLAFFACLIVFIISLILGTQHPVGTFGVETDFYGAYGVQAKNLLAGKAYTYQHNPPGYSLLLAGVTVFIGDPFTAAKFISAVAVASFGWFTYKLIKILFTAQMALATTLLLLIALIPYAFVAATDGVGALAILLPLFILFKSPRITQKTCLLSGIFAGLAYLIRANGIFVIIGILAALILVNLNQGNSYQRLLKVICFIVGVLWVTVPWFLYNWQINGSPFFSTAYFQVAAHFFHPQGDEYVTSWQEMSQEFNSFSEVLLHNPPLLFSHYLTGLGSNLRQLLIPDLVIEQFPFPTYLLIMALPLLLLTTGVLLVSFNLLKPQQPSQVRIRRNRQLIFFSIYFLGYCLMGLVGFRLRYYLFLFPVLFVCNIYPVLQIKRQLISWSLVCILCLYPGIATFFLTQSILESHPTYLLEIAAFLKAHSQPQDLIISRKPHLAYLANLTPLFPLANTPEEYLIQANYLQARYLVYSPVEANLWPGLQPFNYPERLPNAFHLIYHHQPSDTLIYEIQSIDSFN